MSNKKQKPNKEPKKSTLSKKLLPFLKVTAVVLSLFFLIFFLGVSFFYIYFIDRIYPNIYVENIYLGGKTKEEAALLLLPMVHTPESISLIYENTIYPVPLENLEISFDQELTLKKAINTGRSGDILKDLIDILALTRSPQYFAIELKTNILSLDKSLLDIAQKINVQPENAEFTVQDGKVKNFQLEKNGLEVDTQELKSEILKAISKNSTASITLEIPTHIVLPQLTASNLNTMGLKELIGSGTSHFTGSIASRIYNINLSALRINNTLIAPNEIFSFNKTVGDISALSGYQQAYIIQNGQTILGDGGGVCQVSTTMFRAALNTGLPIEERHAHAYRVRYYEQDSSPGLDATIYTPSVDFKFKNDTGNYILIQTQIDLKNLILTFNFYGTNDGRTVSITKPTLWDYKPAPADSYTDDPTLPAGQVKQIDFAATGIKSRFEYTVTKNNEILTHQTFYSDFKPWQAKFLRGTKI